MVMYPLVPLRTLSEQDIFIHKDKNRVILKRTIFLQFKGFLLTLEALDILLESLPSKSEVQGLSCPFNALLGQNHTRCASAHLSDDEFTTHIKCQCPSCQSNQWEIRVQSRYDVMENYVHFLRNHVLVEGINEILFYKTYADDSRIAHTICIKKSALKDAWADRPVWAEVIKGKSIFYKSICVVDIALKGIYGCISPREDFSNPADFDYIQEYGGSMKRYQSICFKPKQQTMVDYNLWKGFPLEPILGDIDPFLAFLYEALVEEEAKHVLDFFAHMIQKPYEKPRFCLVLKGGKGTGKNTVEQTLGKELLHASHYYRTSQAEHFFGQFNAHLITNILCVLQEFAWSKKSSYDSLLKEMITETSKAIDQKYKSQMMIDSYSRLVITSNEDWVVPAGGKDERRYCVITFPKEVSPALKSKLDALYAWKAKSPLVASAALMHYLTSRDLRAYSIDKAPHTKGLEEQKRHALKGIEEFVFQALSNGFFGSINDQGGHRNGYINLDHHKRIKRANLFGCFKKHFPQENMSAHTFHECMGQLIGTKQVISNGFYTEFLDLQSSIENFQVATGVKVISELNQWEGWS